MKSLTAFISFAGLVITLLFFGKCTDKQPDPNYRASNKHSTPFTGIVWAAYAPTNQDPNRGIPASLESIKLDLELLIKTGFTGLITYGFEGTFGRELPRLAEAAGFKALIPGIWDINSPDETRNAVAAAGSPLVRAYCVGNEGLNQRYNFAALAAAIAALQSATGKPVGTSEQIEDYDDDALLRLGNILLPNIHPFWHRKHAVETAVDWVVSATKRLENNSQLPVLVKETGFPSAGAAGMSDTLQANFYTQLADTGISFAYFEMYDQEWKNHLPMEPYWGLFDKNRSPKLLARQLLEKARQQAENSK